MSALQSSLEPQKPAMGVHAPWEHACQRTSQSEFWAHVPGAMLQRWVVLLQDWPVPQSDAWLQ
jgi:hypothetical protein